ncbi:MAG: hypothetical protein BMS9Abin33_1292 [Gammaproteobacteria bacterium]|nr:MAG: hypothetical protein BMS9Abin33_1292 [Gammaproteobacteria bacterium]
MYPRTIPLSAPTKMVIKERFEGAMLDVLMQVAGSAKMRIGILDWMNGGEL